jgi:hypothetical protein
MSDMGWTRTDNPVPAWDLNEDSSYFVEKLGLGSYAAYHNAERIGEPRGTLEEAKTAAEAEYLADSARGLKLGEMTTAQRAAVTIRTARKLQAELQANAPAIAAVLADADVSELTRVYDEQEH